MLSGIAAFTLGAKQFCRLDALIFPTKMAAACPNSMNLSRLALYSQQHFTA